MPYFVYILNCSDGTYYIGCTSDIAGRIYQHQNGLDRSAYTFSRRPFQLVWVGEFDQLSEALAFERQVKGWNRRKKAALIENDWIKIHEIVKEERRQREK